MDGTDANMMDSDAPMASSPPPPMTAEHSSVSGQIEVVRRLLTLARQLVDQGKPSQALQAVVTAMRANGGEAAAFQALNRAKELYRTKIQESNAADALASLFAECAIAEALPLTPELSPSDDMSGQQSWESDVSDTSILAQMGRKQVMLDAFTDGSSFICVQCGGLVGNNRKDEHYAFWCGRS